MADWQPISTAPKDADGPIILALVAGHPDDYGSRIYLAFWSEGGAYGDNKAGWYDWGGGLDSVDFEGHEEFARLDPILWQPLPTPPGEYA